MNTTTEQINAESRVGGLASEYPLSTRVFHRHGIDFCCGGGKPLSEVCANKGLDTESILKEIEDELAQAVDQGPSWNVVPLPSIIEHILETYHKPLKEELPRLQAMADKVNRVHGDKAPDVFPELTEVFTALHEELAEHMVKEEEVLFPMIIEGKGQMAGQPVAAMESEHDSAGNALKRLNELTDGYTVPAGACNTWTALWHGLAALERDMHQHIHLENNILFPRALG